MAGGNKGNAVQTRVKGDILSFPVKASETIYRGCMITIDTGSGGAQMGADEASSFFIGISEEAVDNSSGSLGDKIVRVRRHGIFRMEMEDGQAATDLGQAVGIAIEQSSSVDEEVNLVANITSNVIVGVIVKLDSDSAFVHVDIMPQAWDVINLTAHISDTTSAHNAQGVDYDDAAGNTSETEVEGVLDEIYPHLLTAQAILQLPMSLWTLGAGVAIAAFSDGASTVPGTCATVEAHGVRWNNHGTPDPIFTSIVIPPDLDASADIIVHVLAAKTGNTGGDAVTWLIEAFNNVDAALYDADANFGGTSSAMTGGATAKTCQEETLTLANANVVGSPTVLQLSLQPTDGLLGTDDVIVLAVWLEYTVALLAS